MTVQSMLLALAILLTHPFDVFAELPLPTGSSAYRAHWQVKEEVKAAWQLQQSATFPIIFDLGLNCTGVFVGPNGEALTNLHCLEECLVKNNIATPAERRMLVPEDFKLSCGLRFGKTMNRVDAEVLKVFGPGWLKDRENLEQFFKMNPEAYINELKLGFEGTGDLVLIKLPVASSCVKISAEALPQVDKVLNISYPIFMRRTDNPREPFATFGLTQMWSHGQISADPKVIETITGNMEQLKDLSPTMAIEGLTLSSLDAESGASGSPIFNLKGELVSILRSTFKGHNMEHIPWTTQGIEILPKKSQIEALVPYTNLCGS